MLSVDSAAPVLTGSSSFFECFTVIRSEEHPFNCNTDKLSTSGKLPPLKIPHQSRIHHVESFIKSVPLSFILAKSSSIYYNCVNFITNPQHSGGVIHITHIGYVDNFQVKTLCNRAPADGLFYGISAIDAAGKPCIFLIAARGADGVAGRLSTFYPHPLWIS